MSRRRAAAVLTALVLGVTAAGCGSDDDPSGGSAGASTAAAGAPAAAVTKAEVQIKDFKYGPEATTVKAGGSITFTNQDQAPHTATVAEGAGAFDTGTLERGQSRTITFKTPGTYTYTCTFHAYMKGTVTVVG